MLHGNVLWSNLHWDWFNLTLIPLQGERMTILFLLNWWIVRNSCIFSLCSKSHYRTGYGRSDQTAREYEIIGVIIHYECKVLTYRQCGGNQQIKQTKTTATMTNAALANGHHDQASELKLFASSVGRVVIATVPICMSAILHFIWRENAMRSIKERQVISKRKDNNEGSGWLSVYNFALYQCCLWRQQWTLARHTQKDSRRH